MNFLITLPLSLVMDGSCGQGKGVEDTTRRTHTNTLMMNDLIRAAKTTCSWRKGCTSRTKPLITLVSFLPQQNMLGCNLLDVCLLGILDMVYYAKFFFFNVSRSCYAWLWYMIDFLQFVQYSVCWVCRLYVSLSMCQARYVGSDEVPSVYL